MGRFLFSRGLQMAASLFFALTLVFVAVTQLPGDPVRALFGFTPPPPEIYNAIRDQFHLNEPLWRQYLLYLGDVARLDLGNSYPLDGFGQARVGPEVVDIVVSVLPASAIVLGGAVVIQLLVGVTAGALAASQHGQRLGRMVYAVALLLVSTPVLVAAYTLRHVFSTMLDWLPYVGVFRWEGYVLPTVALAVLSTGYVTLLSRTELRETLAAPFIQAARGRGLSSRRVVALHAMRPSLIPVVTFVAANTGEMFLGLLIVEGVFGVPGIGGTLFDAIASRDRTLLVGLVTFIMAIVIIANALAEVLAAMLDPRIRLAGAGAA